MAYDGDDDMPLLWFLRENAGLTGTKYGCGIGPCGARTVHMGGGAVGSCRGPMSQQEARTGVCEGQGVGVRQGWGGSEAKWGGWGRWCSCRGCWGGSGMVRTRADGTEGGAGRG